MFCNGQVNHLTWIQLSMHFACWRQNWNTNSPSNKQMCSEDSYSRILTENLRGWDSAAVDIVDTILTTKDFEPSIKKSTICLFSFGPLKSERHIYKPLSFRHRSPDLDVCSSSTSCWLHFKSTVVVYRAKKNCLNSPIFMDLTGAASQIWPTRECVNWPWLCLCKERVKKKDCGETAAGLVKWVTREDWETREGRLWWMTQLLLLRNRQRVKGRVKGYLWG